MLCPSCHTKNQFFNNYCYYCGHKLKEYGNVKKRVQEGRDNKHSLKTDTIKSDSQETFMDSEYTDINYSMKNWDDKNWSNSIQAIEDESILDKSIEDASISNMEDHPIVDKSIEDWSANIEDESSYDNTYDITSEHLFSDESLFADNNLFDHDTSTSLDISTQMPLRRYQKDDSTIKKKRLQKVFLPTLFIGLIALTIFAIAKKMGQGSPSLPNPSQSIAVSSSIEEITDDGEKAYRVIFNTVNGKEISFLGNTLRVENGRAELVIKETLLYAYNPQLTDDGLNYKVELDAIVSAPSLPDSTERITITLTPPYNFAPFTLLQPASSETEFQGNSTKVSFKIQPDSKVIINEEDLSSSVSEDGRFEKEFELQPQQEELVLDIRVSTPGYLDNIQQIILRKTTMDVPLEIKGTSPISSEESWVKVEGITHPEATLDADREIFEEPQIDRETGDFTVYIKAERPGYTPCTLLAKLDGKESSLEIILDRKTNVDTYTSTAWKPNYDELQQNTELSNGRHFVFTGEIKDIIETGDKNVFTISLSEQSASEQLFYVEYWGSFDYSPGDRLKVFGNRWGNKDDIPRFLAKYIYD